MAGSDPVQDGHRVHVHQEAVDETKTTRSEREGCIVTKVNKPRTAVRSSIRVFLIKHLRCVQLNV